MIVEHLCVGASPSEVCAYEAVPPFAGRVVIGEVSVTKLVDEIQWALKVGKGHWMGCFKWFECFFWNTRFRSRFAALSSFKRGVLSWAADVASLKDSKAHFLSIGKLSKPVSSLGRCLWAGAGALGNCCM